MARGGRVGGVEYAERINAAAGLVAAGVPVAEAARVLAGRFACSERQARRYLEVAARSGAVMVPEPATVFTVKVPAGLAQRVREHARASGRTISAVVAQALEEFLDRGHGNHPGGGTAGRGRRRTSSAVPGPRKCQGPTAYWCRSGGPGPAGPAGKDIQMTSAAIYARVSSSRQAKDQT